MSKNFFSAVNSKVLVLLSLSLLGVITLSGCITDRRTAGTMVDDKTTAVSAGYAIGKLPGIRGGHVNITSYNMHILMTGEVPSQKVGLLAENKIKEMANVDKVYNELIVAPSASFTSRSNDALITSRVKTALITVIDPTRIKVVTERGSVYLMGIVTRKEADAAVSRADKVVGVKDVTHFFQYFTPKADD